jgi:Tfp pilus assembly protein PilX
MKIQSSQHQKGNVLLIALATTSIMGLTLASYLTLTSSQNVNTSRGQSWNLAIPVAEAGLEEALTQLYYNGVTNLTANNWTYSGGQYTKQRSLDGTNYYNVQISANANPTIISQGFVRLPMGTNQISRRVQVTTVADAMFARGMLAKGQIDLNGNNIATDSFDSIDPAYSTGGQYDPAKIKDSGDVATNSGPVNSVCTAKERTSML